MPAFPQPSTPPTAGAPAADVQTLVDAGLMPPQPTPSPDPPGNQPADNT